MKMEWPLEDGVALQHWKMPQTSIDGLITKLGTLPWPPPPPPHGLITKKKGTLPWPPPPRTQRSVAKGEVTLTET